MSRAASWPPRIHFHKASGQDRCRWRGRDYYLGLHGSGASRREYARLVVELADAAPKPRAGEKARPLAVADVLSQWFLHCARRHGEQGRETKAYDRASRILTGLYASLPAAEFDADRLESVREKMVELGWCRTFVNKNVGRIRTIWRWAEKKKLVPAGAWGHLRTLTPLAPRASGVRESEPVRPCSWEDVQAVAGKATPPVRAMLLLSWHTGARPGEFRQMLAGEVDRSGEAWVCRPARHKNAWRGQSRAIVLGPEARAILEPWLEGKAEDAVIFPSRKGTAYLAHSLCVEISRASKRAGVKVTQYQARHACKRRVKREHGLDAARSYLGQKSVMVTDRYDAGVDEEAAAEVAKKMG